MAPQFNRHEPPPTRSLVQICTGAQRVFRTRPLLHDDAVKHTTARRATAPKWFNNADRMRAYPLPAVTCGALPRSRAQKTTAMISRHQRETTPRATPSCRNDILPVMNMRHNNRSFSHDRCVRRTMPTHHVFNSMRRAVIWLLLIASTAIRRACDAQRFTDDDHNVQRADLAAVNSLPHRASEKRFVAKAKHDPTSPVITRCFKMTRKFADQLHIGRCTVRLLDDHTSLRRNGTALRFECVRAVQRCANRNNARSFLDEAFTITLHAATVIGSSRSQPACSDGVR